MNIAYIVAEFPKLTETFIAREIHALEERGFRITVFSLRRPRLTAEQLGEDRTGGDTPPYARSPAGGIVYPPPLPSLMLITAQFRQLTSPVRYLRDLAAILAADCPHPIRMVKALRRFLIAVAFAERARKKAIEHVHAQFVFVTADTAHVMASLLGVQESVSAHAWDIYTQPTAVLRRRLANAAWVSACTKHAVEYLRGQLPKQLPEIHYAPHGLDLAQFSHASNEASGSGQDRPLILGIGRLEEKKGFCYLIDAIHILLNETETLEDRTPRHSLKCTIIGDGPKHSALRSMVDQLGLQGTVSLPGAANPQTVWTLLSRASAMVLPSVIAPDGDRDGLANVILEAMATGTPVITTTASAASEVIRDEENGFLVAPHDPAGIADRIRRILIDTDLRNRVTRAACKTVSEQFDIDKTIRTYENLFRQSGKKS
ncbi:MAG: glycosyltransferase family 4 protein [Candidatus Pacebacteria bacterium]|nr:glycosyltransferase family 4 protein [Candidatus Paceibacterota bacterium]